MTQTFSLEPAEVWIFYGRVCARRLGSLSSTSTSAEVQSLNFYEYFQDVNSLQTVQRILRFSNPLSAISTITYTSVSHIIKHWQTSAST